MSARPPLVARRWVRIVIGAAIAGNLLGAAGAMYVVGGGTDELSVDEAVERYRESTRDPARTPSPSPTASAPAGVAPKKGSAPAEAAGSKTKTKASGSILQGEPKTGVYVYATEGYEETDALSGQRHDYPAQTALTVSSHGCGMRFRWQPLKERWEETDGCRTSEGIVLSRFAIYHEFFKRGVLEDFALDQALVMPAKPVAGASWHWKGQSDDTSIDTLTTVVGFETIAVGSEQVRTVHIRYESAMSGANEGAQTQDRWMTADTGLLVRMITAVDAKVAIPFGGKANYSERYRIDLTSTTPSN